MCEKYFKVAGEDSPRQIAVDLGQGVQQLDFDPLEVLGVLRDGKRRTEGIGEFETWVLDQFNNRENNSQSEKVVLLRFKKWLRNILIRRLVQRLRSGIQTKE